ncbi:MAG TPA: hypothetical protein P5560_07135 [Thermotogota bacterium]|nr:hypothetical protein [Thermotogota bacterium]HRW92700.1 hypothetical protein [Thermotogota bacterium]
MTAKNTGYLTGAIFLIGLAIIFWVEAIGFWPWILALIGIAAFPQVLVMKGLVEALQTILWMVGLALLFHFSIFWPGILILIGVSILLGIFSRHDRGSNSHGKGWKVHVHVDEEKDEDW